MRTSRTIPAHETILLGDRELARRLAEALAVEAWEDRVTHNFHAYPAGLNPDTARLLVGAFEGEAVLDPFCGGGTVLVEARLHGRRAVGLDVSPTALRVARARTATPDPATITAMRSRARRLTEIARGATDDPPEPIRLKVQDWYAPHVLRELEALRRGVAASDPMIRPLLEAVLSSILVKVSWRASDTSAKRKKHHRPPGTAAILFHKKARELGRRLEALREQVPAGTPEAEIVGQDARRGYRGAPVDLVLTSPPYPGTYDYVPLQHLRRVWLGDGRRGEMTEVGARRAWRAGARKAKATWIRDTRTWTAAAAKNLVPGGHLAVVIGDGLTPAGAIDTSGPTEEAAHLAGLVSLARASVERIDHARRTVRWEHVLVFRKPA